MKKNFTKFIILTVFTLNMHVSALNNNQQFQSNGEVALVRQRNEEVLSGPVPKGYPARFVVPANKRRWDIQYPAYQPPYYVARVVLEHSSIDYPNDPKRGWADPEDFSLVDRSKNIDQSFYPVKSDKEGRPLNPFGRTGIAGRGLLGKWGPNFAADPVITRLMADPKNPKVKRLEMLAIFRADAHKWAIPGGMVDAGERASESAKRELKEETNIDLDMSEAKEIYKGYVADPRNTDNSWMETSVYHKHLPQSISQKMVPEAIDPHEVKSAQWVPIDEKLLQDMYAAHAIFMRKVLDDYKNNPGKYSV